MANTKKILDFETEKLRLRLNEAFVQRDKEHFFYLCDVFDTLTIQRFSGQCDTMPTKEQESDEPASYKFTAGSRKG